MTGSSIKQKIHSNNIHKNDPKTFQHITYINLHSSSMWLFLVSSEFNTDHITTHHIMIWILCHNPEHKPAGMLKTASSLLISHERINLMTRTEVREKPHKPALCENQVFMPDAPPVNHWPPHWRRRRVTVLTSLPLHSWTTRWITQILEELVWFDLID